MELQNNIIGGALPHIYLFTKKQNKLQEVNDIFQVESFSQLIKNISNSTIQVDCTDYEYGKSLQECQNKFKGDLFEVFTILFLNCFGGDRALKVHDVNWAKKDQEGWDFQAVNNNNTPVTIQSKFVASTVYVFEGDGRLETFFGNTLEGQVQVSNAISKMLFTSATKIGTRYRRWEREGMLYILDKPLIEKYTKDNAGFWNASSSLISQIFLQKS